MAAHKRRGLRLALVVLLACCAAAAEGAAHPHREKRPRPGDRAAVAAARARQLPAPLWAPSGAGTWDRVGGPATADGAAGSLRAAELAASEPAGLPVPVAASAASDLADNPLLDKTARLPRYADIKPEHVAPGMAALVAELGAELDALEAAGFAPAAGAPATYASAVHALERLTDRLEAAWGAATHLKAVADSPALRAAVAEARPGVVALQLRLGQSRPLYDALRAVKAGKEWAALNAAQRRVVDLQLRDLELGGVALAPAARARFNELQMEMAELANTFSNNVLDSTSGYKKLLTSPADVAGIPAAALARAALDAAAAGHVGATAERGPWAFTLDGPSYSAVMTHARSRALREELYRASIGRAASGATDNAPVIDALLARRAETARLLGFPNYAEYSMATKMATLPGAFALLEELRAAAWPAAERELAELRAFAAESGHDGALEWWDVSHYAEKLRAARYDVTDEALKPYLPLSAVLDGMFKLATRLFGITVAPADGQAQVWHPDVRFFEVRAANGSAVAHLYIDPYSRPGQKRGGAWMDSVVGRSALLAPDGARARLPAAVAVCNSGAPVGGQKEGLLSLREVTTMFHEFGHTLQHMLTAVDEGLVAGIRGVPWDAVEVASQFMENWVLDRPTLLSFARHHETGAPMPPALFDKLVAAGNFRAASGLLRQVNMATKDLVLHSSYAPGGGETVFDVERRVAATTLPMPPLADDRSLCSFGHIFTGGYAAGYYSYKWSEVLSADAFASFEAAGLGDERAVRAAGARYAATVLALGGAVPAPEVYQRFLGRAPSTGALLRHSGLAPAANDGGAAAAQHGEQRREQHNERRGHKAAAGGKAKRGGGDGDGKAKRGAAARAA